jgi:alkylation response protein AidB-like acyl-CoA dehydrogenase
VHFENSSEQDALRDLVEQIMLAKASRPAAETPGLDRAAWQDLHEVGLLGLVVPEGLGGAGAGAADLAIVSEGLGRHLRLTPYTWSSAFSGSLVAQAEQSAFRDHLAEDLCEKQAVVSPGFFRSRLLARSADGDGGDSADGFVVPFGADARWLVAQGPSTAEHVSVHVSDATLLSPLVDQDRSDLHVVASASQAALAAAAVGTLVLTRAAWERSVALAKLSLAACALGGQERLTRMASDYARERTQFGRPIGSYQAIAHRCADMYARAATDRVLVQRAAWHLDSDRIRPALRAAALAKGRATAGYAIAATATLQTFGGHGFASESDVQAFYRHAMGSQVNWGSPSDEYAAAASTAATADEVTSR